MKLLLSQNELEQAVRNYVTGMISLQDGTDVVIDFKAGRGENGITAEVDINYLAVTSIPSIKASVDAAATSIDKQLQPAAEVVKDVAPVVSTKVTNTVGEAAADGGLTKLKVTATAGQTAKSEEATQTRETKGKSLFGNVKDVDAGKLAAAANDASDAAGDPPFEKEEVEAEKPAPVTGGRRTLFTDANAAA